MRGLSLAAEIAVGRFRRENSFSRIAPLQLTTWVLKAFVAVAILVAILYAVGINPTTVVTGLGLGGIALAFAAQKTIENVFGTVMIVVDQPVRVGDFCKIGDSLGTIEEIGLSFYPGTHPGPHPGDGSERSACLDGSRKLHLTGKFLVSPHYQFEIRNHSRPTPPCSRGNARLFTRPCEIRSCYNACSVHPVRQRVPGILELFAYVLVNNVTLFLEVQEELLLNIAEIIADAGTGLAFPSQVTYLAKDAGFDVKKSDAAIEQVRKRRKSALAS